MMKKLSEMVLFLLLLKTSSCMFALVEKSPKPLQNMMCPARDVKHARGRFSDFAHNYVQYLILVDDSTSEFAAWNYWNLLSDRKLIIWPSSLRHSNIQSQCAVWDKTGRWVSNDRGPVSRFDLFFPRRSPVLKRGCFSRGWLDNLNVAGSNCGVFFSIWHLYVGYQWTSWYLFSFKLMRHNFKGWQEETNMVWRIRQKPPTLTAVLTYGRGGPDPWQLPVDEALDGYERQLQVPKLRTIDF